jgi:hypothetical protein
MIYFDLDGVMRDICKAANVKPETWDCKIDGLNLVDFFNIHRHLLISAPPYEYCELAYFIHKYIQPIKILTNQPEDWRATSIMWLNLNFHADRPELINTTNKAKHLKRGDILIEDNPTLDSYAKTVIVDRLYNRSLPSRIPRFLNAVYLFQYLKEKKYV